MENLNSNSAAVGAVIAGLFLFFAFLPMIIANAKSGKMLGFATAMLCVLSVVGSFAMLAQGGLSAMVFAPILSALWIASLICGIAAYLNQAAEKRANDLAFRLLYNELENLVRPRDVSSVRKGQ